MPAVRRPRPDLDPAIADCLSTVIEPTIGLSVIDLGLIYKASCNDGGIDVELTLTSPASSLGEFIVDDVKAKLANRFHAATTIAVELVWQPPWDVDLISDRGCKQLGRPISER